MKRSPLKRKTRLKAKKPLKKSKLSKKKSTAGSKYWRNKADKEITRLFTGLPCLVCQKTYKTVGHHLIPKSRSRIHRHTLENLVPLCPEHHLYGKVISAHSQSALVVQRFVNWLEDHAPDRLSWMREHEWDTGKVDYQARYEFLKALERTDK